MFEYDYDSDEDWEEEQEGESHSDEEDDKQGDDQEVNNKVFVPNCYPSDKEEENYEDIVFNPETANEKGKENPHHVEKEFEKEPAKKIKQPRLWGVCFEEEIFDTEVAGSHVKILGEFRGVLAGNHNCIDTGLSKTGKLKL